MKNIFIVVPSYNPVEKTMTTFLNELKKEFKNILIINDGCNNSHDEYFKNLEKEFIVLKNYKNYGKGRALKNAFNYLLNTYPSIDGIVMCDCDGQHTVKDVKKCALELKNNPHKLILGVRNFDDKLIPPKSKIGNKLTRMVFKNFVGLNITDTQTGLRGLSKELMIKFLDIPGERYEYETNMLILTKNYNIKIKEVEIDTIYIEDNRYSHFNPIKDSYRIYKMFSKNFIISLSTYILDLIIFISVLGLIDINSKILASTIIARGVSSIYHYIVSSDTLFKNMKIFTLIKYYIFVIIQMIISGCFISYLYNLWNINIIIIKIIIDLIIWIINIFIKNEIIFKGEYEK